MNVRDFFRSTRFRVLLCIVAVLTGMMLYSVKQGTHTDGITKVLQSLTAPVRSFSAGISRSVSETLDTYFLSKAYQDENALLREQIATLNEQLIGYDDAMAELEALRDQLGIKEDNPNYTLSEPCTLLMPITNDIAGGFVIQQGTADGITVNAPVICSQGLIGVVTEVSEHFATVTTILSPELSVGAVVLQTGDSGIVEGTLTQAADGKTKLIYVDEAATLHAGDLVMTAGTTGLFPYGIPIGNIVETGMEETGLTAYAILEPSVDLEALESVSVLLDFEGKGVAFHED